MYAAQLLDLVKTHLQLPSDTALAERIGVNRSAISQWRRGLGSPMPAERVIAFCEMAAIAEEDRGYWLTGIMRDAVTTTGVMRALDGVLDRIRPTLAGVGIIAGVLLGGFALPSKASDTVRPTLTTVELYIMRIRRWLRAAATRFTARFEQGFGPSALLA